MPRAPKNIVRKARHQKWLKRAKGFRGRRSTVFTIAKEAVLKAGQHAFHDRRKKKANMRAGWQIRINAAVRTHGLTYSKFIHALRTHNVGLDRKVLAQIAGEQPEIFAKIVEQVQK